MHKTDYTIDVTIKNIAFYLLKRGEQFKFKGRTYKKISPDRGKSPKDTKFFWPQDSVGLISPMRKSAFLEKYPLANT